MPSASEAEQNDAEGGGDYPDGEWSDFIWQGFYILVPDEGPRSQLPTIDRE